MLYKSYLLYTVEQLQIAERVRDDHRLARAATWHTVVTWWLHGGYRVVTGWLHGGYVTRLLVGAREGFARQHTDELLRPRLVPVPHTVHGLGSAPRGRCTASECTMCVALPRTR